MPAAAAVTDIADSTLMLLLLLMLLLHVAMQVTAFTGADLTCTACNGVASLPLATGLTIFTGRAKKYKPRLFLIWYQ